MEKIQKALEKAKRQRNEASVTQSSPASVNNSLNESAKTTFENINYTQTRVMPIAEDILKSNRLVAGLPNHPDADLFRVLRTKVLHALREQQLNSLAITGPTKNCGKSLVAINLAIAMAMESNQTVMLVDLNLRQPALHEHLGLNITKGIADYLLNGEEISKLLVNPGIDRLVLLPAGRALPQSSELLSTPKMRQLIQDIINRYPSRVIIFDLPPLLGLDDALTILPNIEASILVVEEGVNTKEEINQCLHLLANSTLIGCVYNKAKVID